MYLGFKRLQIQEDVEVNIQNQKKQHHPINLEEKMGKLNLHCQDEGIKLMEAFVKAQSCLWTFLTDEEKRIFLFAKHSFMVDYDGSILIKPGKGQ